MKEDFSKWFTNQQVLFLSALGEDIKNVDIKILKKIDADWNITGNANPELKQRWYPIGI